MLSDLKVRRICVVGARPGLHPRLRISDLKSTTRGCRTRVPRRLNKLDCRAVITVETPPAQTTEDIPLYPQESNKTGKPRVVVLGSGWGAVSFLKSLSKFDSDKYDIVVVSPRNYFLYTPLLPAVATGTMEERSIVEPIRKIVNGKGSYFEAMCQSIDTENKSIVACFPKDAGIDTACFKIPYDILVVAVGSVNNTFGVKGVDEHCFYFKSIEDANNLRRRISETFERAALPQCAPEEREELLSFVLVGGGPTGVEVAAEIYDMINEDLSKLYPELMQYVSIKIVDLLDHVLSAYDRRISDFTRGTFQRAGIDLILNTRVQSVDHHLLTVVNKDDEVREIPFGTCVWATGIAKNPLIERIQEQIEGQSHFRSIVTDGYLRVLGSDGSIFALGDAATQEQPRALEYADKLFDQADKNRNGRLCLTELRLLFNEASKEFPQFEEFAKFFDRLCVRVLWESRKGSRRWGRMVQKAFAAGKQQDKNAKDVLIELSDEDELTREEFDDLLQKIDSGLRALPATAQVARQQGEYLAKIFSATKVLPGEDLPGDLSPFEYAHKGSLAYVGKDNAVIDLPVLGPIWGLGAGLVWKSFETYSQFSLRNQFLVAIDWARTKIFGRDISRV